MAMCEALGCLPSELLEKHPDMTPADRYAMMRFGHMKYTKLGNMIGRLFGGSDGSWTVKK